MALIKIIHLGRVWLLTPMSKDLWFVVMEVFYGVMWAVAA